MRLDTSVAGDIDRQLTRSRESSNHFIPQIVHDDNDDDGDNHDAVDVRLFVCPPACHTFLFISVCRMKLSHLMIS